MQDLSNLLGDPINALAPTSQSGGNQIFSNENAQTAPGSQPASPAKSVNGEEIDHGAPEIVASRPRIPVGDTGQPEPKDSMPPGRPTWKTTGTIGPGPKPMPHG